MTEPTITPADVLAHAAVGRGRAARLAAYANNRAAGMRPVDAAQAIGINNHGSSERWLTQFRATRQLPTLSAASQMDDAPTSERCSDAGISGTHQRWHVGRGIVSPDCGLCTADLRQGEGQ